MPASPWRRARAPAVGLESIVPDPLQLVLLSGNFEAPLEDTTILLRDYLAARIPVDQRIVQWPSAGEGVDLQPVDEADVLMVFAQGVAASEDDLARLRQYWTAGRPVVAVRCTDAAFQGWADFEPEVLGVRRIETDAGADRTPVAPHQGMVDHPLFEGMLPFEAFGPLYWGAALATDCTPVLTAQRDGSDAAVAWVRDTDEGHVFCTTLGHPRDFWQYDFLRLVENAVLWAGRAG